MRLKQLRLNKNMTQEQISKEVDITQFTYSNYENNKTEPNIETLKKLANYYNVSLDYLVGREFVSDIGYLNPDQKEFVLFVKNLNQDNFLVLKGFAISLAKQQGVFNA